MTKKIEQVTEELILRIPFQSQLFFGCLFSSILFFGIGFALIQFASSLFALMGLVLIFFGYMHPTLVGFDLLSSYQDTFDVPKLIHPKRRMIFLLNLFFGWTIILWVFTLYIACCPGKVLATTVKYN